MILLLLFIVLLIVFSIPSVQTAVANKLTKSLNEQYGVDINVERIKISYYGDAQLEEVLIRDHHQDTLIHSTQINTSLLSLTLLINNSPNFGSTRAQDLKLNMKRYKGEETDNLNIFVESFNTTSPSESSTFSMFMDNVAVENGTFSYIDENLENPRVLVLTNLNIEADNLDIKGSDVAVDVEHLDAREERGLVIESLVTDFFYSPTGMKAENLTLRTPNSFLEGNLIFDYKRGEMAEFVDKVVISGTFDEAYVATDDIRFFYDELGEGEILEFTTGLNGTLNNLDLDNLQLSGMDRTIITGNVNLKDMFSPEGKDFKVFADLENLETNYYDLTNFLPRVLGDVLPESLREYGNIQVAGQTIATTSTINADVSVSTQLGSAKTNLLLGNLNNPDFATYKGTVEFTNFNVGRLLGNPSLGNTSFNLNVNGTGFSQNALNTQLDGTISKLRFNGYTYRNIKVSGILKNPVFNGSLISLDPNLLMEFNGLADVSKKINVYDFEASIAYADLHALNFVKKDTTAIFKGDIIMNMQGTTIDDAFGTIAFLNTSYQNQEDLYAFDDLEIVSSFEDDVRTIAINSPDVVSGEVEGVFKIRELGALFENAIGSLYTNYRPNTLTTNQWLEFDFDIYNKIVEVFVPEIELEPTTSIRGRVESDESEFQLNFRSPRIVAFNNLLQQVNIQVDNTNPLFNTYIEIDSVATGSYNFSEFNLINVTLNDTLFVRSEIRGGPKDDDVYNLNLYHTINEENNSVVGIQRSDIKFKEQVWFLNENNNKSNKVIFNNSLNDFVIDSLVLSHDNERISLNGAIRDTTYKNIKVNFRDVDLAKITPDIDSLSLGGIVNGNLNVLQQEGAYYPNTSLTVSSLEMNDYLLGNLNVEVEGNKNLTNYDVNAVLKNTGLESLSAKGNITLEGTEPAIDLILNLDNFNISPFSPLGGEAISNIRGLVSGEATVTGNYKNPDFAGSLFLDSAGLAIPFLNVDLSMKDGTEVSLTKQQFNFQYVLLTDTKFGTTATLNGSISHQNFSEWNLDLGLNTNRLLVLDTKFEEEALYYGTGFISGNANIYGPVDGLIIDVNATTEKGTEFTIPLSNVESIGDNSFIHFLSPEEKAAKLAGEEIYIEEEKGLELNFELDVTDDAQVEIVVDPASGSTLKGRGAGTLLMEINTTGKFNMWGDFIVYQGQYNFRYAGLVQKVFQVRSGGNINWNGSPERAELDVSAIYRTEANPSILLENPTVNRKIPVEVEILLNGQLEQPEISFEIDFPNVSSVVRSELEYKISDRANRERQALSLVAQGAFFSETAAGRSFTPGNLIAERASGLVSGLFADDDGVFEVGVNYSQGIRTPDQETADQFGLTLSTQISNRVLINGKVGVPIGGVSESVVVGDVQVDFLLNEEGTLRAKIFNRQNDIQYIGEELGYTQGVGLSYFVDFNTFKELVYKILNKEMRKQEETQVEEGKEENEDEKSPDFIVFPEN